MADITIKELQETTEASDSSFIPIDNGTTTQKITVANYNSNANATAKHYAEQAQSYAEDAATSETNAGANALKSEGFATGTQNGTTQSSGPYYQNNAKYFKEQAALSATDASTYANNAYNSADAAASSASSATAQAQLVSEYIEQCDEKVQAAEAWAVGQRGGVDVDYTDDTYNNNSKYYANHAQSIFDEIKDILGVPTFTVNFETGDLEYTAGTKYTFAINTTTGDLEWEVTL